MSKKNTRKNVAKENSIMVGQQKKIIKRLEKDFAKNHPDPSKNPWPKHF